MTLEELQFGRILFKKDKCAVFSIFTPPNPSDAIPKVKLKLMFGEDKEDLELTLDQVISNFDFLEKASNYIDDPFVYASFVSITLQTNNTIQNLVNQINGTNRVNPNPSGLKLK